VGIVYIVDNIFHCEYTGMQAVSWIFTSCIARSTAWTPIFLSWLGNIQQWGQCERNLLQS